MDYLYNNDINKLKFDIISSYILSIDCYKNILLVNKHFYNNFKEVLIKINILQKWWRKYRLPDYSPNPDLVTHKTLLRYYIAKYKPEWLQRFPRRAISKLGIAINDNDIDKYYNEPLYNISTHFRDFCNKYMIDKRHFLYYGW